MVIFRHRAFYLCASAAVCRLPMTAQPCTGQPSIWAFDSTSGLCMAYKPGFCQTNANKFYTKAECEEYCAMIKDGETMRKSLFALISCLSRKNIWTFVTSSSPRETFDVFLLFCRWSADIELSKRRHKHEDVTYKIRNNKIRCNRSSRQTINKGVNNLSCLSGMLLTSCGINGSLRGSIQKSRSI